MSADLVLRLETSLPAALPVGRGTALFCSGFCFHREAALEDLEIVVDGSERRRPTAFGMPRPDVFAALGAPGSYRSGFWATVPLAARDRAGAIELALAARLAGGHEGLVPLGEIEVVDPGPAAHEPPASSAPELIAVCMATFEPDPGLFRAQVESLRAQTDERWTCVISDDASGDAEFAGIAETVGDDPRFALRRFEDRVGHYANFERALRLAPAEAALLALCDQDDVWHPDKLRVLRSALGDARLVYSDQRLIDSGGRVLRPTLWKGRRNNHTNLASLLVANTITGAAMLLRREVAELALPFPEPPGVRAHDHWLGLVALAGGDVAYVDRPLYDYVQHGAAIFGDVSQGIRAPRAEARGLRARVRRRVVEWRAAYFYGYLARVLLAQALLVRASAQLTPRKRAVLERFSRAATSPLGFAWLALRPVRLLLGRTETLASEVQLVQGVLWRWFVGVRARRSKPPGRAIDDAGAPDPGDFSLKRLRRWRADV